MATKAKGTKTKAPPPSAPSTAAAKPKAKAPVPARRAPAPRPHPAPAAAEPKSGAPSGALTTKGTSVAEAARVTKPLDKTAKPATPVKATGNRPLPAGLEDLSPVKSSKTSGPLTAVTSAPPARPAAPGAFSDTRPPTRDATGGMVPDGLPRPPERTLLGMGPVPGMTPPPPDVRPDPSVLQLDENRGALSAHGYRLLLMHPETIMEIQLALEEKIGLEAGQIIYRGGYVIGLREARRQRDAGISDEEIVKNVCARLGAQGWGIFKMENLDLWRHELVFRVDHSPFAYAYGKSATGVDHLVRGVFSGVCEVIFDKKVVATESMCRAMGDDHCQFMVG